MIGIEKLKKDISTITNIIEDINRTLEDSKISISEIIHFAFNVPDFFQLIKGYKQSINELKDLSLDERKQIIEHMKMEFDLSNDKLEEMIENIIEVIVVIATSMKIQDNIR